MSVRDELRNEAARLNIKGRSKMTKDELLAAIQDTPGNWVTINKRGDVSVQEPSSTDGIVDADDLVTVEFPGAVDTETTGQEITHVSVDPGKTFGTAVHRAVEAIARDGVVDDLSGVQERVISEVTSRPAQGNRAETLAWIEEEVAAGRMPFPYGLRGRGIGAKTYNQVSDRTLNRQIKAHTRKLNGHPLSSPASLPVSEKVQKYARQNSIVLGEFGILPDSGLTPKLTPAQYRRVRKTRNKHGGDLYVMPNGTDPADYLTGSFSKLARTPDGASTLFHQFAR